MACPCCVQPPPCDPPCGFPEICCDGECVDPRCEPCHTQTNPGQYVEPNGSWFSDCHGYQGVIREQGATTDIFFPLFHIHSGSVVGELSAFAPAASPFIGAFTFITRPIVVNGNLGSTTEMIPVDFDDCGDGTDCGWADYEAAQAYWAEGCRVVLWVDSAAKETDNQIGDFLTGIDGGYTNVRGWLHRYRAFVFCPCDDNWQDKTEELLKRTELQYYIMTLSGMNSVDIEPQYEEPLHPSYRCTRENNPLP